MAGNLLAPALWAAAAGATLTFTAYSALQAVGPVEREEATIEARHRDPAGTESRNFRLVLRTASGERLDTGGPDKRLDLRPGTDVLVEISEVGRAVQAIEVYRRRIPTDTGGGVAFWALLFGGGMLVAALGTAAEAGRPALAALSTVGGLGAGVLPVLLLF